MKEKRKIIFIGLMLILVSLLSGCVDDGNEGVSFNLGTIYFYSKSDLTFSINLSTYNDTINCIQVNYSTYGGVAHFYSYNLTYNERTTHVAYQDDKPTSAYYNFSIDVYTWDIYSFCHGNNPFPVTNNSVIWVEIKSLSSENMLLRVGSLS